MATNAKCGWAVLSALALVLSTACGPAECPDNGACLLPDGGTCPAGTCTTDGGDAGTDGGPTPSQVKIYAPDGVGGAEFHPMYDDGHTERPEPWAIPGCENVTLCTYSIPNAGAYGFAMVHPDYRAIPLWTSILPKFGQTSELRWNANGAKGQCGLAVGDEGEQGHWPYRDPEHADWGKVYFQTVVFENREVVPWTKQVVLNDLGALGAHKLLTGSNWVVVTGLNFSGQIGSATDGQEFSGEISADRETITYRLVDHFQDGHSTETTGTFHRYHPQ